MPEQRKIKTVAIIGAGASGAITAAALAAEKYYDRIVVYERRESAGGTWIYDAAPPSLPILPGQLPAEVDPPLEIPSSLPRVTEPSQQQRWERTPIYDNLTTNVPAIAMSFSDVPFAYGPFVPHHIPRQYIEGYFAVHGLDGKDSLQLSTTVEDVSRFEGQEGWKLTLRKFVAVRGVDFWWEELVDAVVIANGHYAVPFIPEVKGLKEYTSLFPGRVIHSKVYRAPELWRNKRVLTIGNSASGHDISVELVNYVAQPLYQSRRSPGRWDSDGPPQGFEWKPIISEFLPSGRIVFEDGTYLDDIETVIYCTGYLPSYPFWNAKNNGRELYDYGKKKLRGTYLHTFFSDIPDLAIVGLPRVLTFRSFEYQAIAIARLWAGRSERGLPEPEVQKEWEKRREGQGLKKFHDIVYEKGNGGETVEWFGILSSIAGLGRVTGEGRRPPRLGPETRWAIENVLKYPIPGGGDGKFVITDRGAEKTVVSGRVEVEEAEFSELDERDWVLVDQGKNDHNLLGYI